MFRWLFSLVVGLMLASGLTYAAYVGTSPLPINEQNVGQQAVGGTGPPGQPVIPLITQTLPGFSPIPTPPVTGVSKSGGLFDDAIGRQTSKITDGRMTLALVEPNKGAARTQPTIPVSISPNPSLQCSLTAAINQTASSTVITNPGGKFIHVCGIVLISATQQGVTVAEGTGSNCGTGTVFWDGGSGGTAQVAGNGGFAVTNPQILYPMQINGDNVCVLQSASGNVSGHINYGIY